MLNVITPHMALPLPDARNTLAEDVVRIQDAFCALDAKIAALDALLSSDDISLDTVQELVGAIKAARTDMSGVNALVAGQLDVHDAAIIAQLAAQNAAIDTQLTAQNAQITAQIASIASISYAALL